MAKPLNITGKVFNRLTVIKRVENNKRGNTQWLCRCACDNNEKIYSGNSLTCGNTQSCGCLHKERATQNALKTIAVREKYYNTYDLTGEYGIGFTSTNEEFYFDLEDYDKIKEYLWHKDRDGYIVASVSNKEAQTRFGVKQHRLITNAQKKRSCRS